MKLHIQNIVDVITNSSSELFIINNYNGNTLSEIIDICLKKLDDKYLETYKTFGVHPETQISREYYDYCMLKEHCTESETEDERYNTRQFKQVIEDGGLMNYELGNLLCEHFEDLISPLYREILSKGKGCSKEQALSIIPKGFEEDFHICTIGDMYLERFTDRGRWYNMSQIKDEEKRYTVYFRPYIVYDEEDPLIAFPERFHHLIQKWNEEERQKQEKFGKKIRVYIDECESDYTFNMVMDEWEDGYDSIKH